MSRALIVVDVQNDFCEGGALGVTGGRAVARAITDHLAARADSYAAVVATRDDHEGDSTNGGHFAEPGTEPDFSTTWPVHCVSGTPGHAYAPELDLTHVTHHVLKGQGVPAYSGFEGHVAEQGEGPGQGSLASLLDGLGVSDVDVVGLATDHCVRATVLDARALGLGVRVLEGLHAGVAPETVATAMEQMRSAGAEVATGA